MTSNIPIQLTFRGMPRSLSLETNIRERSRALTKFFDRIVAVRVVVEAKHRHHEKGRLFHIRVEIEVPGDNVIVEHESHDRHEHEDPYVAVRDAFKAASRCLEDHARKLRADVKTHAPVSCYGHVVHVSPPRDFGFIRMPGGKDVYFHRNSLVNATLESINLGDRLRFTLHEMSGVEGPHASGVQVAAKAAAPLLPSKAIFRDRRETGRKLTGALAPYRDADAVVLGIPRGGVPVAGEVARLLEGELDVSVALKLELLGAPGPAIGAVTASGVSVLNEDVIRSLRITASDIERLVAAKTSEARELEARFRRGRRPPSLAGRTVIIVDDGVATGMTIRAAIASVRAQRPKAIVAGVGVGSIDVACMIAAEVDELVCLEMPDEFWAIADYYELFEELDDQDVLEVLDRARIREGTAVRYAPGSLVTP
jgi:predicted phosphoribosyltransferase/cold shock CspA family protein/ribosome-associated translation inhibitor RaiA